MLDFTLEASKAQELSEVNVWIAECEAIVQAIVEEEGLQSSQEWEDIASLISEYSKPVEKK